MSVHDREPNLTGLSLAPFIERSKRHVPDLRSSSVAAVDSSSSAGCIRMNPIPSALQSDLSIVGFEGSYRASTGDDVIHVFMSSNSWISAGVHARMGGRTGEIGGKVDGGVLI